MERMVVRPSENKGGTAYYALCKQTVCRGRYFLARNENKRLRSRHLFSPERKRNKIASCEAAAGAKGRRIL